MTFVGTENMLICTNCQPVSYIYAVETAEQITNPATHPKTIIKERPVLVKQQSRENSSFISLQGINDKVVVLALNEYR